MGLRQIGPSIRCALAAVAALLAFAVSAQSPVVDNVNGSGTPPYLGYIPNNAGWVYQPAFSYVLDGIWSTFRNVDGVTVQGPVAPRTVTLSVYEGSASGPLLARTSFAADGFGGNYGGSFTPVLLLAGRKYFIAYDNIYNLGLNITNWMPNQAPGTVNLDGWYFGPGFSTYIPRVVDGVLQVFSAPILRFTGARAGFVVAADCLLDWAERQYPQLFAQRATATSQVFQQYYYRFYSGTRAYVGVSGSDGNVYYLGPDGALQNVGTLASWLRTAGCPAALQ